MMTAAHFLRAGKKGTCPEMCNQFADGGAYSASLDERVESLQRMAVQRRQLRRDEPCAQQ